MEITSDQFLLIGGIILLAIILLGVGIYGTLRSRKPDPDAPASPASDKPTSDWMKNLAGTAGRTVIRRAAPVLPPDAIVVFRDAASSEWLVEINGMAYRSLKDIHDDRAANKILEALSGLQGFAGSIPLIKPAGDKPQLAAGAPGAVTVAVPSHLADLPSQPTHPAPPNSIVDQIEKILQRNLVAYPELTPRRIHVGVATDGSLLIEVDRQEYHNADEVPDERVRNLIRDAIREWEHTA